MVELEVAHEPAESPYAGMSWAQYEQIAGRIMHRFEGQYALKHYDYVHPVRLQRHAPERFRKPYPTQIAYTEWGDPARTTLVCTGGVANAAHRFNYLASELREDLHVISMDWAGRGLSGWLAAEKDYGLETYVEQVHQLILHLGGRRVALLGSSLGGSVAIALAARHPELIGCLILNDIGPHVPAKRRRRRAETLARHYVFRSPADMFRKTGASQKNDGPVSDDVRLNGSYNQTKWSDEDGGRIYRHDVRALQAYRAQAGKSLVQWRSWERVSCEVLVIHGMDSDALLAPTIERMKKKPGITLYVLP